MNQPHFKGLLCALFSLIIFLSTAQTDPGIESEFDFLPAPPNAASLGKYGEYPVDLSNGAVNVSIPIYTFRAGSLSIPISMSYRTTGIKVDQLESWLGLGWDLNAGGVITRSVMDLPDEDALFGRGGLVRYPEYPSELGVGNWETDEWLRQNLNNKTIDLQPDEFNYNFLGYSGKFFHNSKGQLVNIPKANLKIDRDINAVGEGEIIITTPDGIKHYFGGTYVEKSKMVSGGGTNCVPSMAAYQVTSYYLYKIEHPDGDIIDLEYTQVGGYLYDQGVSRQEERRYYTDGSEADCNSCQELIETDCKSIMDVLQGQKLSKISNSAIGEVQFDISGSSQVQLLDDITVLDASAQVKKEFSFTYLEENPTGYSNSYTASTPQRFFLEKFSEINPTTSEVIQSHDFAYNDPAGVAPRLSYAQDHWGYFNGENNTDFLPNSSHGLFINSVSATADRSPNFNYAVKGTLSSITYPTGGKTDFHYESNSVYDSYETDVTSAVVLDGVLNSTVTDPITSAKGQLVNINISLTKDNETGGTVQPTRFYIKFTSNDSELFQADLPVFLPGDDNISEVHAVFLPAGTSLYAEIVMPAGTDINSRMSFSYVSGTQTNYQNQDIGGIRIARIEQDANDGTTAITKKYTYDEFGTSNSSGHQRFKPYYLSSYYRYTNCSLSSDPFDIGTDRCDMMVLNANSPRTLLNSSGSHVTYSNVTISHGNDFENGKEEVEFEIMDDAFARVEYGAEILEAPLSNFGWKNGMEKERRTYRKETNGFTLLRKVTNSYVADPAGYTTDRIMKVRRKFDPWITRTETITCNSTNVQQKLNILKCSASHAHEWQWGQFSTSSEGILCVASGAINELHTYISHPCKDEPVGATVEVEYITQQLDVAEYQRMAYWHYKDRMTEELYDDSGGTLTIVHEYEYDNPNHLQLSRYRMTNSNGDVSEESHYYPHDYDNLSNYNISELKEGNFVVPIKKHKTVHGGYLVNGSVIKYNTLGQPVALYEYANDDLVGQSVHQSNIYIPTTYYDLRQEWSYSNNKLAESSRNDGRSTAFIWGFSGKYPVAKIENATHTEIQATGVNLTPTGNMSASAISQLKSGLPNSLITIYEYDPIYGLISTEDPNGLKREFVYDESGRLSSVLEDGDVVQKYEYRFKNND